MTQSKNIVIWSRNIISEFDIQTNTKKGFETSKKDIISSKEIFDFLGKKQLQELQLKSNFKKLIEQIDFQLTM